MSHKWSEIRHKSSPEVRERIRREVVRAVKPVIKRLFRMQVWRLASMDKPYPMYFYSFRAACNMARMWTERP